MWLRKKRDNQDWWGWALGLLEDPGGCGFSSREKEKNTSSEAMANGKRVSKKKQEQRSICKKKQRTHLLNGTERS